MERLQKLIAHSGIASRRSAEDMIREGRVTVDGMPAHLGQKIDPEVAQVAVDGVPLPVRPDLVHYLVYKPLGVVSTAADPQGRQTVIDLVPGGTRVYPVGRLDTDTEGLMIVTNDGALTEVVTHPRHGVTKTYLARVTGHPGKAVLERLRDGVDLDDGPARVLAVRIVDRSPAATLLEMTMGEGRNREVRRLMTAVGHDVEALVRVAIGPIRDADLTPGKWRTLSIAEVRSLYASADGGS
ncbi:MAG TPA: pseudouridine synthase [Acidimicrobiia bacterium]|nr:pseudouridine synthase [Acidimicrobiia bacterium]